MRTEQVNVNLVDDFHELIEVMLNDTLTEFQYIVENDEVGASGK